jgi:hypothetical protein
VVDVESGDQEGGKPLYGTCHRCGWKGAVAKVGRHDRKVLRTGRTFGRLCDECVSDLLGSGTAGGQAKTARRKEKNRHVA